LIQKILAQWENDFSPEKKFVEEVFSLICISKNGTFSIEYNLEMGIKCEMKKI
jgi:hypothetical protein